MAPRSTTSRTAAENEPSPTGGAQDDRGAPANGDTFEAAYARLEEISAQLEAGGLTLERSVDLYEEGMRLAERCQALLTSVEQRIETLRQRAGGSDAGGNGGDAGR